jgi:CubicO group peptidase (beta-lactamase class C family)
MILRGGVLFVFVAFFLASTAQAGWREAAEVNARAGGASMVVVERGARIFEDYPNGGGPERALNIASGTKSFSGLLAAAAVKDGLLTLDEKAADTLIEWRGDPLRREITIRQVLTLTSGLDPVPVGRAPTYAAAIRAPAVAEPGAAFDYGPLNFQVFGEIMRRKLKSFEGGRYDDPLAYLQARVLAPAGVDYADWKRGRDGMPVLAHGAEITAREWAALGAFVLGDGPVDPLTILDAGAFAAMFKGSDVNAGYGLAWWLNAAPKAETLARSRTMREASDLFTHPRRSELPGDLVMAAGAGGQRLYLIPSRKLAIVRQHPKLFETRWSRRRSGDVQFSDVEFLLAALSE